MNRIARTCLFGLAFMVLAFVPTLVAAAPAARGVETTSFGWFTDANGRGGAGDLGFALQNDAVANWWDAWKTLGRQNAVGWPASQRFTFEGFTVQVNQKLVFQKNDAFGGLAFLNVFDVMSQRGDDPWLEAVRSVPPPFQFTDEAGLTFNQIRDKRLKLLSDVNPAIRAVYDQAADPVSQYGLPVSFKDYGSVFVVRAQRAVFQQWKEDVPWARRGQVVIANGGDIFKEKGYAGDAATPVAQPAGGPPSVAAPSPGGTLPAAGGVKYPGVGYGFQISPANDLGRALSTSNAAGFGWVKVQLRWEDLEGSPGAINWGLIDEIVNQVNGSGAKLMFSVVTAPGWARRDDDRTVPGPPRDMQTFANFVGAIAARHPGKVHGYEIWNEANLWYEWGGKGRMNAGEYVDMLKRSYEAIKRADPNAVVISGAPTPTGAPMPDAIDDLIWIQQLYAAGAKPFFDALGLHPSGYNNPPDDWIDRNTTGVTNFKGHGSFYFRRYEQIREVMVANGDAGKQMWFTEFGWASIGNPFPEYAYATQISEQQQADFLVRAFQMAKGTGYIGPMFVWNLNFSTGEPENDRYAKRAFSILQPDWTPRAAYRALQAMGK